MQEVTWMGDHVRWIGGGIRRAGMKRWEPRGVDVSPDGSLITVRTNYGRGACTVDVLDGRTCALVTQLGSPTTRGLSVRFSADGHRLVTVGYGCKPTMFHVRHVHYVQASRTCTGIDANTTVTIAGEVGTEFGAVEDPLGNGPRVEFTDEGDVVVAGDYGATVYSGTTLEPVRSWAWPDGPRCVCAIQAHRGLLYVAFGVGVHKLSYVYVYE